MALLNRTVLIIKAKQPMADWLRQLPDLDQKELDRPITPKEINKDNTVFLIPEFDMEPETTAFVQSIKLDLFEEILGGWYAEPSGWPKGRTTQMFDEWFDVEFHTVIEDLCDAPLFLEA
jgi:hypothetical protein